MHSITYVGLLSIRTRRAAETRLVVRSFAVGSVRFIDVDGITRGSSIDCNGLGLTTDLFSLALSQWGAKDSYGHTRRGWNTHAASLCKHGPVLAQPCAS